MNQILHILKKDLRRYRWAWLALIVFAVMDVYLRGTTAGLMGTPINKGLGMLSTWLGTIVLFVVIVMIIQEETLVDPDADWISRPVNRGKLLVSKLLSLVLLLSISQFGEVVILVLNQGASRIPHAILGILPAFAACLGQVFLSAQTRSLPRYLLLAVSLYVGLMLVMFLGVFASESSLSMDIGQLSGSMPAHTAALVQTLYWLIAGVGILTFLYHTRRIAASWVILIGVIFLSLLLTRNSVFEPSFDLDGEKYLRLQHLQQGGTIYADNQESVEIIALFSPQEIPEEVDLWASVNNASLRSDDREISLEASGLVQKIQPTTDGLLAVTLGYAPKTQLAELGEEVTAEFSQSITLSKPQEVGRIPLKERACHVQAGNRLAIRHFYHSAPHLTVSLGASIPEFLLEPKEHPGGQEFSFEPLDGHYSFSLVDRDGTVLRDFDLLAAFAPMEFGKAAEIRVEMQEDRKPEDFSILIHRRSLVKSAYSFFSEPTTLK